LRKSAVAWPAEVEGKITKSEWHVWVRHWFCDYKCAFSVIQQI